MESGLRFRDYESPSMKALAYNRQLIKLNNQHTSTHLPPFPPYGFKL